MYAVISTGGKQYRVSKGDTIQIEKLDKKEGDTILFDKILLISNNGKVSIGKPFLKKSKIEGVIEAQGRDKKISIIKFHRRKHYKKQAGHRQSFTQVKITNIAED
ncbi:MAG: 50S ribosomal protein L21 [Gammaproteobacteria bacterium]|jgi:large subunit ribosomal protein L21|nr:50S ribosomal protein L21 [Gammaproteobacteria bacterium]MBT7603637.1 50S ribosomal protein L21 [Gammaproteobacteria bacterium]